MKLALRTKLPTNMELLYVASYLFMQAVKSNKPPKEVSAAQIANR